MLVWQAIVFIISAILLARVATYLVSSLTKIGQYLKIGDFAISFILMAFVTSLPELFVGIYASFNGGETLALGTVIGSNIVALTLILGIAALVSGSISLESVIKRRDITFMVGIQIILILLLLDRSISRPDAVILLLI